MYNRCVCRSPTTSRHDDSRESIEAGRIYWAAVHSTPLPTYVQESYNMHVYLIIWMLQLISDCTAARARTMTQHLQTANLPQSTVVIRWLLNPLTFHTVGTYLFSASSDVHNYIHTSTTKRVRRKHVHL